MVFPITQWPQLMTQIRQWLVAGLDCGIWLEYILPMVHLYVNASKRIIKLQTFFLIDKIIFLWLGNTLIWYRCLHRNVYSWNCLFYLQLLRSVLNSSALYYQCTYIVFKVKLRLFKLKSSIYFSRSIFGSSKIYWWISAVPSSHHWVAILSYGTNLPVLFGHRWGQSSSSAVPWNKPVWYIHMYSLWTQEFHSFLPKLPRASLRCWSRLFVTEKQKWIDRV